MKTKNLILIALLLTVGTMAEAQKSSFGKYFTGGTLRIDCTREGSAEGDSVWVSRWIERESAWHGSHTQLIDPFDNGDYRVEMRDAKSGRVIYSRGYSNLFREYKDTPEGRTVSKRFEETLLVPMPKRAVRIALMHRDMQMRLEDQTVVDFNPATSTIEQSTQQGTRSNLELHGDPATKVDVVIVAQGYDTVSNKKLQSDYSRMTEILFGKEPFSSHRADFNVYGVRGDAGAEYNTFGADRYLMTFDLWHLHDLIGATPCDYIIIMVNNETYGGGAIYNFYAVSSLHSMAEYVLPHEFGHSFGGLADEYVDEDLSYSSLHLTSHEPLEPNITNLTNFGSKWIGMLAPGTPIPTPESPDVERTECGPLGAFEGAGYSKTGVFRPAQHCMMRDYAPFCPVCMKRLEEVFSLYTR